MRSVVLKFIGQAFMLAAVLQGLDLRAAQGEHFPTPEAAVKALADAAAVKDTNAINRIFGPELRGLITADAVEASNNFALFARRIGEKTSLIRSNDTVALDIGKEAWPFPIPLVQGDGGWYFDTAAGKEEILNRRIGMNELGTIRVCQSYVEAQREYASADRMGDGVLQYAQRLRSTPGLRDGLYWHAEPGQEMSPFGPLIAESRREGYHKDQRIMATPNSAYHGYCFKILTRQGRAAAGGKYSYVINGRMIAGFAMVAWPEQWGNSGIMTFIVNQQGRVFEKNLGPGTVSTASRMTTYNPDSTWKEVSTP